LSLEKEALGERLDCKSNSRLLLFAALLLLSCVSIFRFVPAKLAAALPRVIAAAPGTGSPSTLLDAPGDDGSPTPLFLPRFPRSPSALDVLRHAAMSPTSFQVLSSSHLCKKRPGGFWLLHLETSCCEIRGFCVLGAC